MLQVSDPYQHLPLTCPFDPFSYLFSEVRCQDQQHSCPHPPKKFALGQCLVGTTTPPPSAVCLAHGELLPLGFHFAQSPVLRPPPSPPFQHTHPLTHTDYVQQWRRSAAPLRGSCNTCMRDYRAEGAAILQATLATHTEKPIQQLTGHRAKKE